MVQQSVTASFVIFSQLQISNLPAPNAAVGLAYSFQPAATGGNPPYTWSLSDTTFGLSIDSGTGAITGTPTKSGTVKFTVTDTPG